MKSMKALVLALAAVFGAAGLAGCASEPHSRSTGTVVDDAALTAKVKLALARDKDVPAHNVNVTTYRGVVQLSGFVQDENTARKAGDVARNVEGVRDVFNDLRVAPAS
jgi:osmotically-inducible protein OsmY